jgi:hypothetical protein
MLLLISEVLAIFFKNVRLVIFTILFFWFINVNSQNPEVKEEALRNEVTIGFNANTNGALLGGVNARFTYLLAPKKFNLFELELVNVKHEKEERFSSTTSSSFIPGKLSYLLALRPSFGNEKTLFDKYPENGIRLNFTYSAGPTIGIVKPYMVKYPKFVDGEEVVVVEAYDPNLHSIGLIKGDDGILSGMNLAKLNLGIHGRSSLNFEYGPYENVKLGVETGVTFEAYSKKNVLLVNNQAKRFYSALFFHIYYGISF